MVDPLVGPGDLRRLLDAVVSVGSELDLPTVLCRIVESAVDLVDAEYGALGVLDPTRTRLIEFVTVGVSPEERAAIGPPPEGHGILGLLIVEPQPLRLPDLSRHPDSYGFPPNHPSMGSFLGVPVLIRGQAYGNLYLTNKAAGAEFSDVDEELVVALAAAAGVAIDNARLHSRLRELTLLEDRERIARDLHDTVIQRLFATGLNLQGAARLAQRPEVAERIQQAVEDLDDTVRQIRTAIFELETARMPGRSLREAVLGLVAELEGPLRTHPVTRFEGPVDSAVGDHVAEHLLSTLREALTNVAKHADASRVEARLAVAGGDVVLEVIDDGVGISEVPPSGLGLNNMRQRAESLGGEMTLSVPAGGGTALTWRVPVAGG